MSLLPTIRLLLALCCCLFVSALVSSSSADVSPPRVSLLYSVQHGEGFSLRRDAFVRMGVALMFLGASSDRPWQLVLPPLSSSLSPHWTSGVRHSGVSFRGNIPWASLYDMEHLAQQTGVTFVEHAQWSRMNQATIDHMLHFCSFRYDTAFFDEARLAVKEGRAAPNSSHPRAQLFLEFPCDATPPAAGFCGTPLPAVSHSADKSGVSVWTSEYGSLRLSQPRSQSVHCGLANLQPIVLPNILRDYVSASTSAVLVSNVQLVFWPPQPYPGTRPDPNEPIAVTHAAKTLFLRSLRLEPKLAAIAHTFIRHALEASPALPLDSIAARQLLSPCVSASPSLPPYLGFHVRRGDFLSVHADVVPDLTYLAMQITRRVRTVRAELSAAANPVDRDAPLLSSRVFVSSDMSAVEFAELQRVLQQVPVDDADAGLSRPTVVRFDLESMRISLRAHLTAEVNAFLDASIAAASSSDPAVSASATPLTPFHILLLDQYLCESSLSGRGLVGTHHSYVSELIWQNRRARGLEPLDKWDKDVLSGGAAQSQEAVPKANHDAASAKVKDEL